MAETVPERVQVKAKALVSRQPPLEAVMQRSPEHEKEWYVHSRVCGGTARHIQNLKAQQACEYRHTDAKRGAQETHLIPGK